LGFFSFLKGFSFFAPSYQAYLKLGYKARIYNGDFIFTREYEQCIVHIHQSVEPHNKKFSNLIDFEIDDACVIFEFNSDLQDHRKLIDTIREKFDFSYERDNFLFSMNKNMDFNDSLLESTICALHIDILNSSLK